MHCLLGTETLAQQDVDAKTRQRVTSTEVLKRIILGNQVCLIR